MKEPDFVEQLRQRDRRGLEALHLRCGPLMRYVIAPILPDSRDREECLSDVLMRVWEKIDTYDPKKGSFTTWLTVITRNTALNRARQVPAPEQELTEDLASPEGDPEVEMLRKERQAALRKALNSLSREDEAIFYRKYYYRQSTAQVASELGITQRAVEGRLYRIRKRLRKQLGGVGSD